MSADNSLLSQIANPTPVKLADPMEMYSKFLMASHMQSEIAKEKQEMGVNNALIKAGQDPSSFDAQGNFDARRNMQLAGQFGAGTQLGKLNLDNSNVVKNSAETYMNRSKGDDLAQKAILSVTDGFHKALGGVDPDPAKGLGMYVTLVSNYLSDPLIQQQMKARGQDPNEMFNQMKAAAATAAAGGPDTWKQFNASTQDGFLKAYAQTPSQVDAGSTKKLIATNFTGTPTQTGEVQIQRTPAEAIAAQRLALDASKLDTTVQNTGGMTRIVKTPAYGSPGVVQGSTLDMQQTPDNLNKPGQAATTKVVENFINNHAQARELPTSVKHIDAALDLLDQGKAATGVGQARVTYVQRLEKFLNMPVTGNTDPAYTQELNKYLSRMVLDDMKSGPGSARTTNMITKLTQNANPDNGLEPEAIRAMLLSKRQDYSDFNTRTNDDARNLLNSPQVGQHLQGLNYGTLPDVYKYTPASAVDHLKADLKAGKETPQALRAKFDDNFGTGASARVLGGSPTGQAPF